MIVKNEEDWIGWAVQGVRSIVSEVIIADTGSSEDSTLSRVKGLADKFLKLRWHDSFGESRKATLLEATKPWILAFEMTRRPNTLSIAAIEAQASGCVLVTSAKPGLNETVQSGRLSLLQKMLIFSGKAM